MPSSNALIFFDVNCSYRPGRKPLMSESCIARFVVSCKLVIEKFSTDDTVFFADTHDMRGQTGCYSSPTVHILCSLVQTSSHLLQLESVNGSCWLVFSGLGDCFGSNVIAILKSA